MFIEHIFLASQQTASNTVDACAAPAVGASLLRRGKLTDLDVSSSQATLAAWQRAGCALPRQGYSATHYHARRRGGARRGSGAAPQET